MIELLGYLGASLLAVCAIPQAFLSIRSGNSYGLSHGFIWSWYLGEILMLSFVLNTVGASGPLFWNYLVNTGLLTIITYYRYFPRRK